MLDTIKSREPGIEEEAKKVTTEETASIEELPTAALYKKGNVTQETCTELTCIFVALTLYRNPHVRIKTKSGEALRAKLTSCLSTRDALGASSGVFESVLKEMADFLKSSSAPQQQAAPS